MIRVVESYQDWPSATLPVGARVCKICRRVGHYAPGHARAEVERHWWIEMFEDLTPRYRLFRVDTLDGPVVMTFRYIQTCGWLPSVA